MESFFGPWDLGRLFGDTFNIYFKNFLRFIAIAAMATIILTALALPFFYMFGLQELMDEINVYNTSTVTDIDPLIQALRDFFANSALIAYGLFFIVAYLVGYSLIKAALAHGTAQHFFRPQIDPWTAYGSAWKRIFRYILVNLLIGLAVGALAITLVGIPIAIWLGVRWVFVGHAVLFEDARIGAAFSRSSQLINNNWWRALGYGLLFGLITSVINSAISMIPLVGYPIGIILTTPITIIGLTLFYFSLRVENEGYSTHRMKSDLDAWDEGKKPVYTANPTQRNTGLYGNRFDEQESAFCSKCGASRTPDSNFCIRCGKPFDENNTPPDTSDKPENNNADDNNNEGPFIR